MPLFKLSYIPGWCNMSEMNPLLHRKQRWLTKRLWYSWLPHNGSCQLFVRCINSSNIWEKAAILGPLQSEVLFKSDVIMGCNARKDYYGIMPSLWLIHSQVTIVIEVQFDERWVLSSWKYGDYDTAEIPTKESWCAFDV